MDYFYNTKGFNGVFFWNNLPKLKSGAYVSSIKWIRLAHFLTPNFTPKIFTHKIFMPNTHA